MRYVTLPPKIARSLPTGEIEPNHRPDGLSDEVIDALIEAAYPQADEDTSLYIGADEHRRTRRRVRQLVRLLPYDLTPAPNEEEVA